MRCRFRGLALPGGCGVRAAAKRLGGLQGLLPPLAGVTAGLPRRLPMPVPSRPNALAAGIGSLPSLLPLPVRCHPQPPDCDFLLKSPPVNACFSRYMNIHPAATDVTGAVERDLASSAAIFQLGLLQLLTATDLPLRTVLRGLVISGWCSESTLILASC